MSVSGNFNMNPLGNMNQEKSIGTMTKQEIVTKYNTTNDLTGKTQIVKDLCRHAGEKGDTKEARDLFMIAACLTLDTSSNQSSRTFLHNALFEMAGGNKETFDKFHGAITAARAMQSFDSSYAATLQEYIK